MKANTNCLVISKYKNSDEEARKKTLRLKLADLISRQIRKMEQKE